MVEELHASSVLIFPPHPCLLTFAIYIGTSLMSQYINDGTI
jgi:hypothetical protein